MRRLASLLAVSAFVSALWAQEASSTLQFKFTEKQRELFDATVELNGNLPIPGAAGMAGSLKMKMTVFMEVEKVEEGGKATVKAGLHATDPEDFETEFNGQPFPVGLDMARNVIPDSTATVAPNGKLSGLQGGGGLMGFQLPGLRPAQPGDAAVSDRAARQAAHQRHDMAVHAHHRRGQRRAPNPDDRPLRRYGRL
jgi:hypothetical protein